MKYAIIALAAAASVSAANANNSCPSVTVTAPVRSSNASIGGNGTPTLSATLHPRAANTAVNFTGFSVDGVTTTSTLTISGLSGGTLTYYLTNNSNNHAEEFSCPLTGILNSDVTVTLTPITPGQTFSYSSINMYGF